MAITVWWSITPLCIYGKPAMKKLTREQIFRLLEEVQSIFDEQHEMRDWRGPEHLGIELDSVTLDEVVIEMDATCEIDGMIVPDYEVTLQELLDAEVLGDNTLVVKTTRYRLGLRDPVILQLRFMRVVKTPIKFDTL